MMLVIVFSYSIINSPQKISLPIFYARAFVSRIQVAEEPFIILEWFKYPSALITSMLELSVTEGYSSFVFFTFIVFTSLTLFNLLSSVKHALTLTLFDMLLSVEHNVLMTLTPFDSVLSIEHTV